MQKIPFFQKKKNIVWIQFTSNWTQIKYHVNCVFFLALTFKYIRNHKHCFTLQWIDPGNFNNFAFYYYYFVEIQNQTTLLKLTFLVCLGNKRQIKWGKTRQRTLLKKDRSTIQNRNSTKVSKMVGGLYLFKLEHSYQVITLHILRQPWPSKLHDEEIWLKITAVYSELHEMYFESNEIFKRKSLDHSNCFLWFSILCVP